MADIKYDRKLHIKTTGIREWKDPSVEFNRCESTPYRALDKLFKKYKFNDTDEVVDFGAGRGRVAFYIHNNFQISVTGIEVHDMTFDEVLRNKRNYRYKASDIEAPIKFEYGYAEQYEIKKTDNTFYFFNPFSANIFKKVVENILKSVKEHKRSVDIILYYPLNQYKRYLNENTPFKLINKIKIPERTDKKEKFLIYRLLEEDIGKIK